MLPVNSCTYMRQIISFFYLYLSYLLYKIISLSHFSHLSILRLLSGIFRELLFTRTSFLRQATSYFGSLFYPACFGISSGTFENHYCPATLRYALVNDPELSSDGNFPKIRVFPPDIGGIPLESSTRTRVLYNIFFHILKF